MSEQWTLIWSRIGPALLMGLASGAIFTHLVHAL